MSPAFPIFIVLGVIALVAVLSVTFGKELGERGVTFVKRFSARLEIAGINRKPEEIVAITAGGGVAVWVLVAVLFHPGFLVGALLLPLVLGLACGGFYVYVLFKSNRRREAFLTQLEVALRLISSGLRIGLSLRQAMGLVVEELQDPARIEFARMMGQTNIGISPYDALDDMADRLPSGETLMLARVVRIQSQTGGNLATILEQLAGTIKERRRMARKVAALTAEGRMGALVLESLPIGVALFLMGTQHDLAVGLLTTAIGHYTLMAVAVLETAAILWLNQMLKVRA
ncbi:MAG: type II secretion system F family protein [Candidatus Eremiobacteraeota bacterium]|nr:type II secretion system F family protein [Candidatus Eremiobacteraeota bacterium]